MQTRKLTPFAFSKELETARLKKGLTRTEAADAIGITRQHLRYLEDGLRNPPSFPTMVRICRLYDVDLNHFAKFVK